LVNINHIDNFNKFINDFPISHIIKRKNTILNNEIVIHINIPDSTDEYLYTAKHIVENDADIDAKNDHVFRRATSNGNLDIIKCLIKYGAEGLRHSWRCSRHLW
jgi:hypothetical protein